MTQNPRKLAWGSQWGDDRVVVQCDSLLNAWASSIWYAGSGFRVSGSIEPAHRPQNLLSLKPYSPIKYSRKPLQSLEAF